MAGDNPLAAVEEELAFQGESLRGLNDALALQQQDILLLKRQLALLADELKSLRSGRSGDESSSDDAEDPADSKPPHY